MHNNLLYAITLNSIINLLRWRLANFLVELHILMPMQSNQLWPIIKKKLNY